MTRFRFWTRTAADATLIGAALAAGQMVPAATWIPVVRRRWFPGLAGVGDRGHVALTFDDGPDPASTPRFLDVLEALDVRATFFLLGERVTSAPQLAGSIAAAGHEVAVHGWAHDRSWLPTAGRETARLKRAVQVIESAAGVRPQWYRPPYGVLTGDRWMAARRVGLRPVLWTAWGRDWTAEATAPTVLATVRRDLRGGGTVLLHDSDFTAAPGCWHSTLEALPDLVRGCRDAGMAVGPLGEHGLR